jgi:hypothetical protein
MEILYNATIKQSFFDVDGKHDYYTMRVVTSLEPGGGQVSYTADICYDALIDRSFMGYIFEDSKKKILEHIEEYKKTMINKGKANG